MDPTSRPQPERDRQHLRGASDTAPERVTRLAPSPTGSLHLGNARTFAVNWALARSSGWRITLRVEDLDTPRIKPGAVEQTVDELAWLGLDWDEPQPDEPIPVQTTRLDRYRSAMGRLAALGLVYPCELTRAEIERVASAPQEGAQETPFPPELRPETRRTEFDDAGTNWRFCVPDAPVAVRDRRLGEVVRRPAESVGDFVVWTKRGTPAYQLAAVVDDAEAGVNEIVRADDLLDSAARQLLLWRALSFGAEPLGTHLPLVVGADGRRLAKRHGDTRLSSYRARGVSSERVIGLLAAWSGVLDRRKPEPMSLETFRAGFSLGSMSPEPVVMSPEDEAWLTA